MKKGEKVINKFGEKFEIVDGEIFESLHSDKKLIRVKSLRNGKIYNENIEILKII